MVIDNSFSGISYAMDLEEPDYSTNGHFDTSKLQNGLLLVKYTSNEGKKIKLTIEKDTSKYIYNLMAVGGIESFPLQLGDGKYKVCLLENMKDNTYIFLETHVFEVDISDDNSVFLNSVQNINWSCSEKVINKAKEITKNLKTDSEKIKAIHKYLIKNYKYDYDKLNNLPSTYLPNLEDIMTIKKGICYDFASLYAGMLRSVGIPAKLQMGYVEYSKGYHAWNEVYISSSSKWVTIDTSYDAQMRAANIKSEIYKKTSIFKKVKEY